MCLLWSTNSVFISQKTTFFIVPAVKTSNLTSWRAVGKRSASAEERECTPCSLHSWISHHETPNSDTAWHWPSQTTRRAMWEMPQVQASSNRLRLQLKLSHELTLRFECSPTRGDPPSSPICITTKERLKEMPEEKFAEISRVKCGKGNLLILEACCYERKILCYRGWQPEVQSTIGSLLGNGSANMLSGPRIYFNL
jgi:hypothetical protein